MIECKFCKKKLASLKSLESHLVLEHKDIAQAERIRFFREVEGHRKARKRERKKKIFAITTIRKAGPEGALPGMLKVRIYAQTNAHQRVLGFCRKCGFRGDRLFCFEKTSHGRVLLCSSCKRRLSSKGKRKPRLLPGGLPETNRVKY